jgi:hypothetical protein
MVERLGNNRSDVHCAVSQRGICQLVSSLVPNRRRSLASGQRNSIDRTVVYYCTLYCTVRPSSLLRYVAFKQCTCM